MLLNIGNRPNFDESGWGQPYDSAYGMPMWSYIVALAIILYITIRVWIALKKDKKGQKNEIKRRNPDI